MLGASLVPCAPATSNAGSPLAVAEHAGAEHPPDCHRVEGAQLVTPCPCGCNQRASSSVTARLGLALLAQAEEAAAQPEFQPVSRVGTHAPEAPLLPIDHVPLGA